MSAVRRPSYKAINITGSGDHGASISTVINKTVSPIKKIEEVADFSDSTISPSVIVTVGKFVCKVYKRPCVFVCSFCMTV